MSRTEENIKATRNPIISELINVCFDRGNKNEIIRFIKKFKSYLTKKEILALKIAAGQIKTYYNKEDKQLDLSNLNIRTLGNLKIVKGTLNIQHTQIKTLGCLKEIHEHAFLDNTPLESFGNLKYIKGLLSIEHTNIKDFGNINFAESKASVFTYESKIKKEDIIKIKIQYPKLRIFPFSLMR